MRINKLFLETPRSTNEVAKILGTTKDKLKKSLHQLNWKRKAKQTIHPDSILGNKQFFLINACMWLEEEALHDLIKMSIESTPEVFRDKHMRKYKNNELKDKDMDKVIVKFKKTSELAQVPQYQTSGSAGFDLHSIEDVVIKAGEFKPIKIGLSVEIPQGYEMQIRARSGLAFKNGITILNGVGTIDSDYRGEIMGILVNHSKQDFIVKVGDRIAQGIIAKVEQATLTLANDLSDTERGSGGFGSTGV